MKKVALAISVCLFVLLSTQTSLAMDEEAETILKFLGGVYIVNKAAEQIDSNRTYRQPNYGSREQRILRDAYEAGVRAREREQLEKARRRAYECGYTGRC